MLKVEELIETLKKDAVNIFSIEELKEKLESGKKLKIKLGADPSRPDLHLGHTVVLNKLKLFQEMGHEIYFVIGDFTAMIGDPTGKNITRPALSLEQTRKSGETYFKQVTKILDPEKTHIVYNSDWLSELKLEDVIKLTGKYTIARIMERDDFSNRFKNGMSIGLHEILYPLMQGYDSVHLNADIEIGGTDQTFNLLVGRYLQSSYGQISQVVITFPLLPGLDGVNKMSKSLDNYIGIDEDPFVMFEKCMKVPDDLLEMYFELTTDLERDFYLGLLNNKREAHLIYANYIVSRYHTQKLADEAKIKYEQIASGAIPDSVQSFDISGKISIIDALYLVNLVKSKSEARRLIDGGAISVNGNKIKDFDFELELGEKYIVKKGKSKFVEIKIN